MKMLPVVFEEREIRRLKEGSESVTTCNRLKMPAADGKSYLTDVASAETLLCLVQSVPSPKAKPIIRRGIFQTGHKQDKQDIWNPQEPPKEER